MDCTVWNERHRTRLAFRRPGAGAHRDIERGKVPSAATAVSPFLYYFTMCKVKQVFIVIVIPKPSLNFRTG